MGNGQIGYDISPYEALTELKGMVAGEEAKSIINGTKRYIQHLEKNQKNEDDTK